MMTSAAKYHKINVWLFLIGIGISSYLVYHHYQLINGDAGFGSFCSINTTIDCDAVNASVYSEVLGIPLATWGLSYYLFALVLSMVGWRNAFARREATLVLFPFTILSAIAAIATMSVTFLVLKKFCIMCSSMQLIQLITLVTTWLAVRDVTSQSTLKHEVSQMQRNRITKFAMIGIALLALTHLLASQLKKEMPYDENLFITSLREQPVLPVEAGDSPRMGFQGEGAPLQLIEFADFQCPSCAMAARQMHRLVKAYGDRVQLVFKNFPLDPTCNPHITRRIHDYACYAAKTAHCAGKQGHFAEMYEKLFANQKDLSVNNIEHWAAELGLDKAQLETCMAAPETLTAIQKDADQANSLGLEATPTFFANGRKVQGIIDEPRLKTLLLELAKPAASSQNTN